MSNRSQHSQSGRSYSPKPVPSTKSAGYMHRGHHQSGRRRPGTREPTVTSPEEGPGLTTYRPRGNFNTKVEPMMEIPEPLVVFSRDALKKMAALVDLCSVEVGWMMTVYEKTEGTYFVDEVFLPEQSVSSVRTNIGADALGDLAFDLLSSGEGEKSDALRGWGHSHVEMEVSPSATDQRTMLDLFSDCEWGVRLICNKHGDFKVDFYDFESGFIWSDVQWQPVPNAENQALREATAEEMKRKLTKSLGSSYRSYGYGTGRNLSSGQTRGHRRTHANGNDSFQNQDARSSRSESLGQSELLWEASLEKQDEDAEQISLKANLG